MSKLLVLMAAMTVLLVPVAHARDWGPGMRLQAQGQAPAEAAKKRAGPPVQRGERPRPPEYDKRGQGRLTQEERRELHRDLDRANREIYRR